MLRGIKRGKKAALSAKMIVTIILLIMGFIILLFFMLRFVWTERVDKEVCHESVILRATLPSIVKEYIPLKCKTAKYCITTSGFLGIGGGKCNGKGEAFQGEKGITKVKVKSKEDIERFLAREIIDCWSMMGEGKVSLFTQHMAKNFGVGGISSSCVICSRIAFDNESLVKAGINFSEIDVLNYMATHKAPNKDVSYLEYLVGEKGKISIKTDEDIKEVVKSFSEIKESETFKKEFKEEDLSGEINLEEVSEEEINKADETQKEFAIMFMQVIAPKHSDVLKNTAYVAFGGAGASAILSPITTIKVIGSVVFWKIALPVAALFTAGQHVNVMIQRDIAAGYCGDVSVGGEARDGCSVVRTINYNIDDLTKYCSIIESIP